MLFYTNMTTDNPAVEPQPVTEGNPEEVSACNNNNNYYLLQMGCHSVAVITLHVFPNAANKFT
jgi:hypothetical protein